MTIIEEIKPNILLAAYLILSKAITKMIMSIEKPPITLKVVAAKLNMKPAAKNPIAKMINITRNTFLVVVPSGLAR